MMLAPTARAGIIDGNPVREDIDEAGALIGIDFIFNVLLDEDKRIVRAVAGHYLEAHRAGAEAYDRRCDLRIPEAADVVVASPGGTPKDINLYQAQKTLDNVGGAVRDGGVIVLVARCREGFGQQGVRGVDDGDGHPAGAHRPHPAGVRARRPQGGGRRRAAGARRRLPRLRVPDDVVRSMCMTPFATVDDAVAAALARAGAGARCLVVPHGSRVTAGG